MSVKSLLLLAAALATAAPAAAPRPAPPPASDWTAACTANDEWDKPAPPFRIHGNSYFVGTCGVVAILITGAKGHVLIDGGTVKAGDIIAANVQRLGFRLKDIKVLLYSHEHFDHVGGIARLQALTGAKLIAAQEAVAVLNSGRDQPDDPQAGMHGAFPAARVGLVLGADGKVALGSVQLTGMRTPGHTPGDLSWTWQSCTAPGKDCRAIVYADSLNPISNDTYRFSDRPGVVAAFRAGIAKVATAKCDILLTPHPVSSRMHERIVAGSLEDPQACRSYAAIVTSRLDARLAQEDAGR